LPLPRRQRAQGRARIDAAAHAIQRRGGAAIKLLAIDDAEARRLVPEQDVGAHVQVFGLDQLLAYQRNAQGDGLGGAARRAAADRDRARIGQVDARGDLHHRRLAGAIAADQADDLAGRDLEIHAAQRDDTTKRFLDPAQFQLFARVSAVHCLRSIVARFPAGQWAPA
jgi:hypothetical protein